MYWPQIALRITKSVNPKDAAYMNETISLAPQYPLSYQRDVNIVNEALNPNKKGTPYNEAP